MLISEKIEQLSLRYNDARHTVAQFLLSEFKKLDSMSMQDVAEATYTSKATLVRVAKALGYTGWNDFIKAYLEEIKEKQKLYGDIDTNFPFKGLDSLHEVRESISHIYMESVYQTNSLCDDRQLEKAARIIDQSQRVGVVAVGANRSLSRIFAQKMIKIGKVVDLCEQADMNYYITALTPKDCVIMISYSGVNLKRDPLSLIPLCKERNIPIIALTSQEQTILRQEADAALTIFSREHIFTKIASYSTEISILFLLDLLYSAYFWLHFDQNLTYRLENAKKLEFARGQDDLNEKE